MWPLLLFLFWHVAVVRAQSWVFCDDCPAAVVCGIMLKLVMWCAGFERHAWRQSGLCRTEQSTVWSPVAQYMTTVCSIHLWHWNSSHNCLLCTILFLHFMVVWISVQSSGCIFSKWQTIVRFDVHFNWFNLYNNMIHRMDTMHTQNKHVFSAQHLLYP